MYLGQHGDVLTFPIEKGKTMNVVAFHSKQDGKWEDDAWAKHMEMNEMMKDFNGWGDDVRKILNMMQHPDVWAIFHHPPAPTYFEKRICLLGDAAHASSPHQGAGAGMVIEDAYVLSSLLGKIKDSKHLEKVFEAYDTFRRPRAQKVVETSADAGELYDLEAEETGTCLDKIGKNVRIRWRWIWDIDLVTHLYEAENQLQKLLKDVQN